MGEDRLFSRKSATKRLGELPEAGLEGEFSA